MPSSFYAYLRELKAISNYFTNFKKKRIYDETIRDRIRNVFRSWDTVVAQEIEAYIKDKEKIKYITEELQKLAKLTIKIKHVDDYRKILRSVSRASYELVLHLPPSDAPITVFKKSSGFDLFLSLIPDLPVSLVPNPLFGWKNSIKQFVEKHHFDKSCFIMIRYRDKNEPLIKKIKQTLSKVNIYGVLASDHNLTDDLYNPIACLLCCSTGIAIFDEPEAEEMFNPNVAYELGMMHLLGRKCLILKHNSLASLQTDILMKLYEEYDNSETAVSYIKEWAINI